MRLADVVERVAVIAAGLAEMEQPRLRVNLPETFLDVVPCLLVAARANLGMSRPGRSPADGRERGGRAFGGLIVAAGEVVNALVAAWI